MTDENPKFDFFNQTIHENEWKFVSGFQYVPTSSSMRLYHKSGLVYFTEDTAVEET